MPAAHKPTSETKDVVRGLVRGGTPRAEIAKAIGVSVPTLRKHYDEILRLGENYAHARVVNALFTAATSIGEPGQVGAAIFWLKSRLGWRDRDPVQTHVHANADSAAGQTLLASLKDAKDYEPDAEDAEFLRRLDERAGADLDPKRN